MGFSCKFSLAPIHWFLAQVWIVFLGGLLDVRIHELSGYPQPSWPKKAALDEMDPPTFNATHLLNITPCCWIPAKFRSIRSSEMNRKSLKSQKQILNFWWFGDLTSFGRLPFAPWRSSLPRPRQARQARQPHPFAVVFLWRRRGAWRIPSWHVGMPKWKPHSFFRKLAGQKTHLWCFSEYLRYFWYQWSEEIMVMIWGRFLDKPVWNMQLLGNRDLRISPANHWIWPVDIKNRKSFLQHSRISLPSRSLTWKRRLQ